MSTFFIPHHLHELEKQLERILVYWTENKDIRGALVSVHYKHIVAKSNRLKILLSENGKSPTESIRGAKFVWEPDQKGNEVQKHVFTHFVSLQAIEKSIDVLKKTASIIEQYYKGSVPSEVIEELGEKYHFNEVPKTSFLKTVVDGFYVEWFDIDRATEEITEEAIITIYQTGVDTKRLLSKFGIDIVDDRIIDGTTLRL